MLVLRSRIPRVSSAAWALRVAALVDAARSRFCLLSTGATRRGRYASRAARGRSGCSPARCRPDGASLGCLSRTLSRRAAAAAPHAAFKAAADESKRGILPTSPRAPQRQMRPARDHAGGGEKKAHKRKVHNTDSYPSEPEERARRSGSGDNGDGGAGGASTPSSTASAGGRRNLLNRFGKTERKSFTKSSIAKLSATEACRWTGT